MVQGHHEQMLWYTANTWYRVIMNKCFGVIFSINAWIKFSGNNFDKDLLVAFLGLMSDYLFTLVLTCMDSVYVSLR